MKEVILTKITSLAKIIFKIMIQQNQNGIINNIIIILLIVKICSNLKGKISQEI